MPEDISTNKEELSEFSDYLAEFDSILGFDAETCNVCGVNISESVSLKNPPYVKYKCCKNELDLSPVIQELDNKKVPYKIEKQLDPNNSSSITYIFNVLVPINFLSQIQK